MKRLALVLLVALAGTAPAGLAEQRIANVSQGTNMALALAPGGDSLIVDLLGRLWRLPSSGGGATQVTPDDEAARQPRMSPDGRRVVYQRLVDGQWDLWLLDVETGERRALADSEHDEREPDFAPDGRSVVFAADRTGRFCLWRVEIATGVLTQLTEEPGDASFPTVSEHGEIAYVRRNGERWSLRALLPNGAAAELVASDNRLSAPSWRPGGGVVLFNEQRDGSAGTRPSSELKMLVLSAEPVLKTLTRTEDVFESRAAWSSPASYFYTADGRIWRRGIAEASRQPVHLFAAVSVESASPAPLDAVLDAPGPNPVLGVTGRSRSEDGRLEVFTALGDLWLTGRRHEPRRLTDDEFVDTDASIAANGEFAVFASDRGGYMDLWRVTLPGGVLTQLTRRPEKAYRPAVSPDGRRVAFLETDGLETLGEAALQVLELGGGAATPRTLAHGLLGPDRPRWDDATTLSVAAASAPGAAVRDSTLRVDVTTGRTSTAPGRVEDPDEDRVAADPEAAPHPVLDWSSAAPDEPFVIQAGRLFDGIRSDYLRHVDVHIDGQRIAAIVARGTRPLPARVVDARGATIIPGLIDVHAHQSSVMGERLGRAWLAHGVTTVRELTGDMQAALERAESWASGRRLGPRLVVSPATDRIVRSEAPPAGPLLSPVPVRAYSGLAAAAALFLPAGSATLWLAAEHGAAVPRYLTATSPLDLYYEDVFSTLVESRTIVTSTLAAAAGAPAELRALRAVIQHPTFRSLYTAAERDGWLNGTSTSSSLRPLQENLVRLVRAGGQVAAGTEAPTIPYGLGVHVELALLADAGIAPDQVLRIGTASNALALGLERQLGTLEAGKLADLVVVDGNPLVDISDAQNDTAVVRGGIWLDQAQLSGTR